LDRIDNNKGHSKDNVKACCCRCNVYRNQHDADVAKFKIQIHKYAQLKGLPMTLSRDDEQVYWDLMRCKTGGLSVVHNRRNLAGIDTINRLKISDDGKIFRLKTNNVITHVIGVDFNSLYPTAFSSEKLPYLDAPILLPGLFERTITCKKQILDYITKRNKGKVLPSVSNASHVFFVSVKGHCPMTEETINFPPIIRNVNITTNRETIGDFTYDYMKSHDIKTDTQETKLTQLLDTRGEFITVYCYYLWFLIDRCGFVIEDIERCHIFTGHTNFNSLANQTMKRRQEAILNKDKVRDLFNKISLNGSYGYDIKNDAKYLKTKIVNKHKCFLAHLTPHFRSATKLGDDLY
jgi:hypothetical protein